MRRLNQNTLVDIARHSNKTLKMADFMVRAGYPFLYGEMARVGSETPAIESIEAFKKDIDKTATQMEQVHELLSTVDENDTVLYLKNDEKNLSVIFGDAYDSANKSIQFSNYTLNLKQPFSKEDYLNQVTKSLVGQDYAEFKTMFKSRNKTFKLDDKSLYTDEDKIYFLSIIKNREAYSKVVDKIRGYGEGFGKYRSDLSLEEKNQIDNEITFNRSMIDSVTQNSTYLTKEEGIVKLGSPHKKEKDNIGKIVKFLKENDFIKAIELDPETSLEGVIDVLNKTKDINFNLDNEVVFKVRKLGNYKANGLYMNSQKIVAVDIKNPSAAIHEFVHAVDLGRDDIRHSQQREDISSKYRNNIKEEDLPEGQRDYYLNGSEIIARLGEIGYLLNQYDYKETESIVDFQKRVREEEKREKPYDLNLAKPVDTYFETMANEYFNVKSMSKNELLEIKEYYQSYFGVRNNDIKPINLIKVDPNEKKSHVVRQVQKHQLKPVSFFSADNIKFALDYNKKEQLLDFDKLFSAIFENPIDIDRSVKKYNNDTLNKQRLFFKRVGEWVRDERNPYLTSLALKSLYPADKYARYKLATGMRDGILNNEGLIAEKMFANEIKEIEKIKEEKNAYFERNKSDPYVRRSETMMRLRGELTNITTKVVKEFKDAEREKFPELQDLMFNREESYALERNASGNRSKVLNGGGFERLFKDFREEMKEAMTEQDPEVVLSCFDKSDLILSDLLGNKIYRQRVFGQVDLGLNQVEKIVKSGFNNGLLDEMVKNDQGGYQDVTLGMVAFDKKLNMGELVTSDVILRDALSPDLYNHVKSIENKEERADFIRMNLGGNALSEKQIESFKEDYIFENKKKKESNDLRDFFVKKESVPKIPVEKPKEEKKEEVVSSVKKSPKGQMKLF